MVSSHKPSLTTRDEHHKRTPTRESLTLSWSDIPHWMQDNEFILSGYRRVQGSWSGCIYSAFCYLHNETVNIQSHFIGAIIFGFLLYQTIFTTLRFYPSVTLQDFVVFIIFQCSAVFCLLASATFHMAACHSPKTSRRCHTLDYSGIIVLIVGSFFPCIYYGFYCHTTAKIVHLTTISTAGSLAAYLVLSPTYSRPHYRWARTLVFIALGLCALIPVTHGLYLYGPDKLRQEMGLLWLLASGGLYIQGALIYANRIPERWYPGRFDIFLASHQIFHVHVVLGALAHQMCIVTAFNYWHGLHAGTCPSPI